MPRSIDPSTCPEHRWDDEMAESGSHWQPSAQIDDHDEQNKSIEMGPPC